MSDRFSQDQLKSLDQLTKTLSRSNKVVLPFFALGIAATLVGAGIAINYILNLSERLEQANIELKRTEAVLEDTNRSLELATDALDAAQEPGEASQPVLATAIREVSKSKDDITQATKTVSRAATRLPVQSAQQTAARASQADMTGEWVDGYGSTLQISQEGSTFRYVSRGFHSDGRDNGIRGLAEGVIEGNIARYKYSDNIGRSGTCVAKIEPGYKTFEESCKMQNGRVLTVTIVRT